MGARMVEATAILLAALVVAAPTAAALALWSLRRRAPTPAPAQAPPRGRLQMAAGSTVRGRVELVGDVTLTAEASKRKARVAEVDVPTQDVDRILKAFQGVGFRAQETGLTVDTDEGEETLTTIELDLDSLDGGPTGGDVLSVSGDLHIERGARVGFGVEAKGALVLEEDVRVRGHVTAHGPMRVGAASRIQGMVTCAQDLRMGAGARAQGIQCRGEVYLADVVPEAAQRISARRIHMDAPE
jgi:hypothetical protein